MKQKVRLKLFFTLIRASVWVAFFFSELKHVRRWPWTAVFLLMTAPALAQVPNHAAMVEATYAAGGHVITTQDGAGLFIESAARALHRVDPGFGHLKKQPPRTRCGEPPHACDVVLYRPTGQIVDLIVDAGEPGARLGWSTGVVGEYTSDDWFAPDTVPAPQPQPQPGPPSPVQTDALLRALIQELNATRALVIQGLDRQEKLFTHQQMLEKTTYDFLVGHDTEPGWLKKVVTNRYVQIALAAFTTWATNYMINNREQNP